MSGELGWEKVFGFSDGTPHVLVAALALLVVFCGVILPSGVAMTFLERKLGADLQARVGPNRSGPGGVLQPLADSLKLFYKELQVKKNWRERLWQSVHVMALYSTVAVLPLGSLALLVDTDMSAFLPFWAALVLALGTMLLGLGQSSVSGWYGGVRVASQALSGAFPALVSILCAGIHGGGFRWSAIAGAQSASPLGWAVFSNPFQFIALWVFLSAGLVLLGIAPLDGGTSLVDLHGGVSAHLRGRQLSLFRLGRFYGFFLWSVIAVVLFLGGWSIPSFVFASLLESRSWGALLVFELVVLLFKTFLLMVGIVLLARVTPRLRADQITAFAWKVLSPAALVALIGASAWSGILGGAR